MRLMFSSVTICAVLLARPAVAQSPPPEATPSVLVPSMPLTLPPPTPIVPRPAPLAPQAEAAPPDAAPIPPPAEPGTITAVPLPPPGTAQPPAVPMQPTPLTPLPSAASVSLKPGAPAPRPAAAPFVSTRLPEPAVSPDASPADFLRAARGALVAGRNGEARSALEMAQTRLLDRSVDAGQERVPSHNLAVKQISEAIDALVANDRMACLRYIEFASRTIGSPLD